MDINYYHHDNDKNGKLKKYGSGNDHSPSSGRFLSEYHSPEIRVKDFFPPRPNPSLHISDRFPPSRSSSRRCQPCLVPERHHQHRPGPLTYSASNGSYWHRDGENYHHNHNFRPLISPKTTRTRPMSRPPNGWERMEHTGLEAKVESTPVMEPKSILRRSESEIAPKRPSNPRSHSSKPKLGHIKAQDRRASFPPTNSPRCTQSQLVKPMLSKETSESNTGLHPLKRPRESNDEDVAKKLCLKPTDRTLQGPTVNVLSVQSSSQRPLCDKEPPPKTPHDLSPTETDFSCSSSHESKSCTREAPMGVKQGCVKYLQNNKLILFSPPRKAPSETEEEFRKDCNPKPSPPHSNRLNMTNDSKSTILQMRDLEMLGSVGPKTVVKQGTSTSKCRKLHRNKKQGIADDLQDLFTPDQATYVVNKGRKTLLVRPDEKTKEMTNKVSSSSVPSNLQALNSKLCQKVPGSVNISPKVVLERLPLDGTFTKQQVNSEKEDVPRRNSETPPRTEQAQRHRDEHSLEIDSDLDLNLDLDIEFMSDSEEEQLVSLHDMIEKREKPEKRSAERTALSESGSHHKRHHTMSSTKTSNHKSRMDQLLEECHESKRAKDTEKELLSACQENLLKIAEFEEAEGREHISTEQQKFLQRFSLTSSAIREVPPGHEVFDLEKSGYIFNQNTLQLRQCCVTPQNTAQKTLLWSSHSQFKLYVTIGLFQEAYSHSPCSFQITRFLFKMLSVHNDKLLSDKILEVLIEIASTAAFQRGTKGNEKFTVWVPSLADITLVLMNMGAPFVSLFPLESLQPPFTERDLHEGIVIKSESPSTEEPRSFPVLNWTNVCKYLSCCLGLCPRFYSDKDLLLLLSLLCTVSLESRLLHSRVTLYPVLYKLLKNIRHWDQMMPKMCQSLTDLTDDHHNMCHLVQLLPHHRRGRKLRQHLSLSMISKLMDGRCLYAPKSEVFQLSDLRPYLPRLKPSLLLQIVTASLHQQLCDEEEDQTPLDHQVYYLCYSLLTLVNEATNFKSFHANQKEQLLILCAELQQHVKCYIREGEKWLYRSKVKDLVARIYTKWQMMVQRTRPLNGKLYDYWQPFESDVGHSPDMEEIESNHDALERDCVSNDDEEGAGTKMEHEVKKERIDMTDLTSENQESALEESSLSNSSGRAVDEDPKMETFEGAWGQRPESSLEDRALHQLHGQVDDGWCCIKKMNSTFVLEAQTQSGVNTEDDIAEDGEDPLQ